MCKTLAFPGPVIALSSAAAVVRAELLRVALIAHLEVLRDTAGTIYTLISHIAETHTKPSIAISILSSSTVVVTIREWPHHAGAHLTRRRVIENELFIRTFKCTLIYALSFVVRWFPINSHE
jgi:hypothetical protein